MMIGVFRTCLHSPKCGQRAGHSASACTLNQAGKVGGKRKLLMDCKNRNFANKRVQPFDLKVDEYCAETGEDKIDLLKFSLQKELFNQGKRKEGQNLGKISSGLDTPHDPLTPQTTLAHVVCSKRSFNQFRDGHKFLGQRNKQVFSGPDATDIERWRINHKAVPFIITDKQTGLSVSYIPPEPSMKPHPPYLNKADRKEAYSLYKSRISEYRNKLRPSRLQGTYNLPEEIHPHHLAVGTPYPNVVAFSLKDYGEKLGTNLAALGVPPGDVDVDVEGSDGCDGMGQYELSSKPTDRPLPDHGLSYDFQLMKVSCASGVLMEANNCSVFSLTPVMRAAANENNHFSTHHLCVPIENERFALSSCSLKVKISDDYTLNATDIKIDTSKIDKKLADEQGGLGLSTYPCLMCTNSKEDHRNKEMVLQGFPINRTYADGVTEGERMRVNADLSTRSELLSMTRTYCC